MDSDDGMPAGFVILFGGVILLILKYPNLINDIKDVFSFLGDVFNFIMNIILVIFVIIIAIWGYTEIKNRF